MFVSRADRGAGVYARRYFDVVFGPEIVVLSTAPAARPTHWAQSQFYYDAGPQGLTTLAQGEVITGARLRARVCLCVCIVCVCILCVCVCVCLSA